MDDEAWAMMDPAWPGPSDDNVGDGRITAWQLVYYSVSKNQGTGILIREGREPVCVADPLTAQDRVDLQQVNSATWPTDSAEAMAALRANNARLDEALRTSRDARVSYGFDLRSSTTWGIKGDAPDQGVSFYGLVDLANATVQSLDVK
jgi:hypothetical protein